MAACLLAELGARVARHRKRLRLTQAELGARAGMSRSTVANVETGRQDITVTTLVALAAALELGPAHLLPDDGEGPAGEVAELLEREAELLGRIAAAARALTG